MENIKKIPLTIHCPKCKSQIHAKYDMSNFYLDGNCTECGQTIHSYAPKMAERIQEKMSAQGLPPPSTPDKLKLVLDTSIKDEQKALVYSQTDINPFFASEAHYPASADSPQSIHQQTKQARSESDVYVELYDDDDKKIDLFAILLNIAAVILVLVYVTIFSIDGNINWILIFLPFIAMLYVWLSNGKIGLFSVTSKQANTLVLFPVFSAVLLAIEISNHSHILDLTNLWFPCILVSAVMGWLYYYIGTRNQDTTTREKLLIPACAIAYAYGVVMFINIKYDTSQPVFHEVPILAEHREYHSGRHGSGGYQWFITIPAVKDQYQRTDIQVSEDFYYSIQSGEQVRVVQKKGFLNIPWYKVESTNKSHPLF